MKSKYFNKLVLATAIVEISFNTEAQNKREVEQIRSKYDLNQLLTMKQNFFKKASTAKQEAIEITKQFLRQIRMCTPKYSVA